MPAADANQAIGLDLHFDALLNGAEPPDSALDPDLTATLRHLHSLSSGTHPDFAFGERLKAELLDGAAFLQTRVIPTKEESRQNASAHSHVPRFFAGAQNDTPEESPPPSEFLLNGHFRGSPGQDASAIGPASRPWWRRLELAAALLMVVVLGGYLAVTYLGRVPPSPSQLSAISVQPEGVVPRVLSIWEIDVESLVEPSHLLQESATPNENIWATGWRDGKAIPMTEPDDPLAVTWLQGSTALGEGGNVVLQGHNDYWDNSPTVFARLGELSAGDRIEVDGTNNVVLGYDVEWVRRFPSKVDEKTQRDILGPAAEESLTLITPAGTYNAKTSSYPEVLVVRARHTSTAGLATITLPDPTECDVTPRTVGELDTLALRLRKPAQVPTPTPPEALDGELADAATAGAVEVTTRTLVACLNANDALRSFALYTDEGLLRLFDFIASAFADPRTEWTPNFASLPDDATPVPVYDQHEVWWIGDITALDDGRISATVDITASQSDQIAHPPTGQPALYIFARAGEQWLVDEVIFPVPEMTIP